LVVDVREPAEFADVRLESGVVLLPLSTFATRFVELPHDRPLLMLCASGNRSAAATAHLLRNGYADVANIAGGIKEWERVGLPVRRGSVGPGEGELA
jgi:rhodanese-related sulfurtransferase